MKTENTEDEKIKEGSCKTTIGTADSGDESTSELEKVQKSKKPLKSKDKDKESALASDEGGLFSAEEEEKNRESKKVYFSVFSWNLLLISLLSFFPQRARASGL